MSASSASGARPRRGLGRGLDALIPAIEPTSGVTQVPVSAIVRNPRQPRQRMNSEELQRLSDSIREHGMLQPLVVTQGSPADASQYTLIAGERRLEAARLAGLATVPAIIREATDQQLLELALVENLQREDLGPLEAAEAYRHLAEDFGLSHEAIAARVGKQRVTVTNTLRLLRLPAKVQAALAEAEISEGHARALLQLPGAQAQTAAMSTVVRKGLNVRQTEELVRQMMGRKKPRPARPSRSAEVVALEGRFRETLGAKVTLNKGRKGGTLVIHFYSDEELNAIADRILGA